MLGPRHHLNTPLHSLQSTSRSAGEIMSSLKIKILLPLAFSLGFCSGVNAVTKCTASDGSVSYVQGNCPSIGQSREEIKVWDSGKGMKIGPEQGRSLSQPTQLPSSDQTIGNKPLRPRNSRHPCNSDSTNPVQARLATAACAVLNSPHDPDHQACRSLASGDWQFSIEKMTVPMYRGLIERCRSTGGTTSFGRVQDQGCTETSITKPVPFQGNRDEIFQLADRSVWEVTEGHHYLHEYRPDVVICPQKERMMVDDEVISVRRIN